MHLELGIVIVIGREHRPHERNVIDAAGQVGPPVADLDAGLSALARADLEQEDPGVQPVVTDDGARALAKQR